MMMVTGYSSAICQVTVQADLNVVVEARPALLAPSTAGSAVALPILLSN